MPLHLLVGAFGRAALVVAGVASMEPGLVQLRRLVVAVVGEEAAVVAGVEVEVEAAE